MTRQSKRVLLRQLAYARHMLGHYTDALRKRKPGTGEYTKARLAVESYAAMERKIEAALAELTR